MHPRLTVLADSTGKLLAVHFWEQPEPGAPTYVGLVASSNQITREVKIPEELRELTFGAEIFKYRLNVHESGCDLVRVRGK
jgi:hypothetical protein